MNNEEYYFWKEFNEKNIVRIEQLVNSNEDILIDLHIHSDHSADGHQTVQSIIDNSISNNIKIISITDHDSINAYQEIKDTYGNLTSEEIEEFPILIPGIEFTVDYEDYGHMCHILKYGINPSDIKIKESIKKNEQAAWNRAEIQFIRIAENKTLNYFSEKFNIVFSITEYNLFLKNRKVNLPEYPSILEYIYSKLEPYNIKLIDLIYQLKQNTIMDTDKERMKKKLMAIEKVENKHKKFLSSSKYPSRVLSNLLATRDIDDKDYPDHFSSGNLSVRQYEQVKINDLPTVGVTVFAHPSNGKLHLLENCLEIGGGLSGIELNYENKYTDDIEIIRQAEKLNLFITKGSDNHGLSSKCYGDINYYKINKNELRKILNSLKIDFEKTYNKKQLI